ncbi:MAG: glycine zipper family protein [Candidatus Rifleibacteriota bacterium]
MTLTLGRRNQLSVLLVFSMMFSIFFLAATPPAEAGFFRTLGKIGRAVAVTTAAVAGGVVGATVGCIGGGPLGAVAGLTVGATLAGIATHGITSNAPTSALAGTAIGALVGGPAGMIGGAVIGGLIGGGIGYAADDENFGGGHGKKGGKNDTGYVNVPEQSPSQAPVETAAPLDDPFDDTASAFPEAPESEMAAEDVSEPVAPLAPEEPAFDDVVPESEGTYTEATEISADDANYNYGFSFQDPEAMSVDESVSFLISKSEELDRKRDAVLANEASPVQYESMLDQRNLVAETLSKRLIEEIQANNGKPGSEYNDFTSSLSKLGAQDRAAVQDIIETVKDSAVHSQVNNIEDSNYKSIADELNTI